MGRCQYPSGFELHQHRLLDHHVRSEIPDQPAAKPHRQRDLAFEPESRLLQSYRERLLIYRLDETVAELSINVKEQANQALCGLGVLEVYPMRRHPPR